MSRTVEFLTLEEVAVIHEDQLRRYGGASGLRDLGLLESAVLAPVFAAYYSGSTDLCWLAAIYMVRLIHNHPFVDGNKRTGAVAARVFLQLNGIRLSGAVAFKRKLESLVGDIAQRRAGEEAAAELLRQWARASTRRSASGRG
ncbi:MAG: type II toxin-antitoxin system death-on-curing family toxin [Candidatus Rokuibacteriota bacterium]